MVYCCACCWLVIALCLLILWLLRTARGGAGMVVWIMIGLWNYHAARADSERIRKTDYACRCECGFGCQNNLWLAIFIHWSCIVWFFIWFLRSATSFCLLRFEEPIIIFSIYVSLLRENCYNNYNRFKYFTTSKTIRLLT